MDHGDVRLDSRDELETELKNAGRKYARPAADCDLVLQAYAAWGADCVHHLRGDFAFAIWDMRRKTLFCARDHFGVKPFYYADLDNAFFFSSVLNCVRLHPDVSSALNETAIGDFLLFTMNCESATTTFRDIQRLLARTHADDLERRIPAEALLDSANRWPHSLSKFG